MEIQICYRTRHQLCTVRENEIIYVETDKDYLKLYKRGQVNPDIILQTLKSLEEQLGSFRFVRIHKSYLVNLQYIKEVVGNSVFLYGQENAIPVGRKYKKQFMGRYYNPKSWSGFGIEDVRDRR